MGGRDGHSLRLFGDSTNCHRGLKWRGDRWSAFGRHQSTRKRFRRSFRTPRPGPRSGKQFSSCRSQVVQREGLRGVPERSLKFRLSERVWNTKQAILQLWGLDDCGRVKETLVQTQRVNALSSLPTALPRDRRGTAFELPETHTRAITSPLR